MNPLVKKEIRLLLPAWMVALLLALVQAITRPYDFYVAALLFLGMTMMALTTLGRETSLSTFSQMFAQPVERVRHWQTKLSVLAVAFLIIFGVWLLAFGFAFWHSTVDASDTENSRNLFITICLIATSTFTGGLWTTLLLRQLAAAFWLTLLVPAMLCGFTAAFVSESQSDNSVIAILCVILGIYSVAGFLFARWLFFRAQDVGWSGGVITLPEWRFLTTRSEGVGLIRRRKPVSALLKKEIGLQQTALTGAAGLLVLHTGVIALRFATNEKTGSWARGLGLAGEIFTTIFWMLWLVIPVMVGCMAVAEERKQGVLEGQLCLPVSRRIQFAIKALIALLLGTFLGGMMPMLLEIIGNAIGAQNPAFTSDNHTNAFRSFLLLMGIPAFSAWLALVSFFASSLARNFLQAAGFAIVTFIGCVTMITALVNGRMFFYGSLPVHSILFLFVSAPTMFVTLLWLAYLNYKNFREGWPLWRRNLIGLASAFIFIGASSSAIYNRAWEIFESAEPLHGPARLSAAEPPKLLYSGGTLSALLPDGRLWTEQSGRFSGGRIVADLKTQRYMGGSNWVEVASDYFRIAGIQTDGSLWSAQTDAGYRRAPAYPLTRIGSDTDYLQVAGGYGFLLLKTNGTLWSWGVGDNGKLDSDKLKKYLAIPPRCISGETNWTEVFGRWARKSDGSLWIVSLEPLKTNGAPQLLRIPKEDEWFKFASRAFAPNAWDAGVKTNGELWLRLEQEHQKPKAFQLGKNAKWKAVAFSGDYNYRIGITMITLRSDGTLWLWPSPGKLARHPDSAKPAQLGTYSGWITLVPINDGCSGSFALAANGGLWGWKDPDQYFWLAASRRPVFLGNIFDKAN